MNAQVKDGSPVSELMTIYTEDDAYDYEKFPVTSRRKSYFKQEEKGVGEMCEIMQEIRQEGRLEGRLEMLIEACQELKQSYETTMEMVLQKFMLSREKAEELMQRYWKEGI